MWENGVVVLRVLKLPRINTINLNKQKKKNHSTTTLKPKREKYVFFSLLENKEKKYNFSFWRNKTPFLLKVLFSMWKRMSKLLQCEKKKKMILVLVVPFKTWDKKIG